MDLLKHDDYNWKKTEGREMDRAVSNYTDHHCYWRF